ncbi:zinc/cadmium resistance protein-like protein [Aaosphaeria arxii CBS 175.79]|uniref:Zinc/cadmium resistance protein-like protein n=1 Tax=Aaosphaeria arxii CBS 175.79 TaxID=1450172 RepID=A0A6A5XKJ8_9PLEO|nr:zinc/cadmium resistance protein-like protein [Aaosphaeria arxii CBS 175.79]KAF2013327.1 zinc/cadmium resistance protein-like protein [Aaosphaeria arxii CBS 175.79]
MGLSKSSRIMILLAIDSAFFLLELVVGYAVHSLALVADSFHMLNDVISLLVGLWAVKVANQRTNSKMYTYGWQRAETLGALVNGVFLVALCLSIFLEAIQRFVEPQEVSHPKLVLIVGCFGLASNIIGLFLFHDHGHSHGGHSHSHGPQDSHSAAEEGHAHSHGHDHDAEDRAVADESGNVVDVLPQSRVGNFPSSIKGQSKAKDVSWDVTQNPTRSASGKRAARRHSRSRSRGYSTLDEIYVHPSSFRHSIIESSRLEQNDSDSDADNEDAAEEEQPTEQSPLLKGNQPTYADAVKGTPTKKRDCHVDHKHNKPRESGKGGAHGHSHGDLNMRGVFLHVMGDALGNIGVIASALIIWLTDYSWRFYSDPLISLIITVIILASAIPLCKAASRILLQAVPAGLSVDEIKEDITDLDGIVSCHHIHVWQLSDTKLIASLHVQVDFDFKGEGSARYMDLAREIRKCLHEYGIHSSTIQPEFCLDVNHDHSGATDDSSADEGHANGNGSGSQGRGSKTGSVRGDVEACLLECGDDCGNSKQCCVSDIKGCGGDNGNGK